MNKKKSKTPKWTLALLVLALVMLGAGGVMVARAELTVFSQDYNAEFGMDHLGIRLLENGDYVPSDGMLSPLEGTIEPGKVYKEEIACRNTSDIDQYVRLSIRKYWMDKNGKNTNLDPALIELTFGDSDFNDGSWQINPDETTAERTTYYYSTVLEGGEDSDPVVDQLVVNGEVIDWDNVTITGPTDGKITYEYKYDGYTVGIEADVQSLQTHNANDAIKGIWGVPNVTAEDGQLTVN